MFALICAVFAATSNVASIVTFTGVITLSYAGLMGLSAIVIRRLQKNPPERYKMPLWPVLRRCSSSPVWPWGRSRRRETSGSR